MTPLSRFPRQGESGERIIPRRGLRGSRRPMRRLYADTWSVGGSAILAEAAFSVANDHIHHPGQTVFRRRTSADERPERACQ